MRSKQEILSEIEGLSKSIGLDSFECAKLNGKVQQIAARIQGNLSRLEQLDSEKFLEAEIESDPTVKWCSAEPDPQPAA